MSPVFVVGCPRSGTHFLAELFRSTPGYASRHSDDVGKDAGDSFLGYAKWYSLPVNTQALVAFRQQLVRDSEPQHVYVESNCYLSLFTRELDRALAPHFVFLVREPAAVVNSLFVKGWYRDPLFAPPSFDYNFSRPNHAVGRLMPALPAEFERWRRLTRIGRIAWFYNALNLRVIDDLRTLPRQRWSVLRVDGCDHACFANLQQHIGNQRVISQQDFEAIAQRRPGRANRHRVREDWTAQELSEFETECTPAANALGALAAIEQPNSGV